jgi:hypothetical protein
MSSSYITALNPKGYVNNREITNLDGQYLITPSKNVLIFNNERVDTRRGMTLITPAKTRNTGTTSSYDWYTSSGIWRNVSVNNKELGVYYKGNVIPFKTLTAEKVRFIPWWDPAQVIDRLLFVQGTDEILSWTGAIAEVASVTSNTITKTKYISGTDIAFNDNGASLDTITQVANGFVTAGFEVGDTITISASSSNDGTYTISNVTAGTLTLSDNDSLTTEIAGAPVVLAETSSGTWGESRFLISGTRKVYIDGTEYTYTGGEGTGTLTGVTPNPLSGGVVAGDIAIQSVQVDSPATLSAFKADLISVVNNYVFVCSTVSRTGYMSTNTDFTNFAYTSPLRIIGEGFEFVFDSTPTALVANEDEMWISAGRDDWYRITFELTADHAGESVRIKKFKTSTEQAAMSQESIIYQKNGITFISWEKSFDFIGKINAETSYNVKPISDPIKEDMFRYNWMDNQGLYFKRDTYICLPRENIVLVYDNESGYWQPPQTMAISRLALIDIDGTGEVSLCGYSNNSNEVYKLFDGFSDNGLTYECNASFGYDNFGTRFDLKNFDEAATELYISPNTVVKRKIYLDYLGSTAVKEFIIDGSDSLITFGASGTAALGVNPLGTSPVGSSLQDVVNFKKARIIHTTDALDFFERANSFETNSDAGRFSILAYAENVQMSENEPTFIKK